MRNIEENKRLLNAAARSKAFIVFDTETTGLKKDSEIIEFAAQKCLFSAKNAGFVKYDELHLYIKPSIMLSPKIIEITGLTDEFLADKTPAEEAYSTIRKFMGDMPYIGAYNSRFDIEKLSYLYSRFNDSLNIALDVDILKIAKDVLCCNKLPNHKLGTVASAYGVADDLTFHSAIDDVTATVRILNKMIADIGNYKTKTLRKITVYRSWYWPGYRHDSGREYVLTSEGTIFYEYKNALWRAKSDLNIKEIDVSDVEKQIFAKNGVHDFKELWAQRKVS